MLRSANNVKETIAIVVFLQREIEEKVANPPKNTTGSWFGYFQYEPGRDLPSEVRNVLLIIVALIAAVTFQAGVNPPGGVWQEDDHLMGHKAGRAIYASQQFAYYVFLMSNTLALSSSILVIVSPTYRFPFHVEVWVATASMMVTYGSAVFAVTPRESHRFRYVLAAAAVPFMVRCGMQMYNKVQIENQARPDHSIHA